MVRFEKVIHDRKEIETWLNELYDMGFIIIESAIKSNYTLLGMGGMEKSVHTHELTITIKVTKG